MANLDVAEPCASTILSSYISESELADQLGVSRKTVRTWRSLGEAPAITRIGKRIFYSRNDVQAWLLEQRVEPAA